MSSPTRRQIIFATVALAAALVLSRPWTYLEQKSELRVPLRVGDVLPFNFSLKDLAGNNQPLKDLRGRVTLVNFWAGWCAPCLHEMPGLYQLQKKLKDRGFVVLGLNFDDDPQSGMKILKKIAGDAPFPHFLQEGSPLLSFFPVSALPFTVVFDETGRIQYARGGSVDWSDPKIVKWIEGLL